ncbi:HTH-type transcriptional repressor PurR [Mycolicibacterium chlorophenolicum]|uniref:HTH-type transcriptional repressor PurR n=2 Tax=Mycolicibacterium chlorophenolicum TaxID=37916 RepID=A0A0J6WN44_9MYCO|nr:HTH-type transcriptional repressor PurR [Mycolicibacterium chlorophenolicum]
MKIVSNNFANVAHGCRCVLGAGAMGMNYPLQSMSRTPTPRRRATLASLAAELKVSRTTVSNAYNRPDQLSAELRERVLSTAKRLGYPGPDPVARSLRTRRAGAVGLIITEPLNYSFSDPAALDFVAGLAESCEAVGQGLLLVAVGPNRSVSDGSAAVLAAGVDGFVIYSASDDDPYLPVVLQRHLPVVVVDQPRDVPGTSRVGIDDRAAMRALAEHVLDLGHREIGLLTMRLGRDWPHGGPGPALADPERVRTPDFHVQSERIAGVRDAMAAAGLDPNSLTVVESYEHLPTSGGAGADVALDANPRITALMCTADVLALSAMDRLRARGVYVPGQMTVTGFDGVPEALSRGLTTVRQPSIEKGRRAGELLHSPPRSGLPVVEVLDTEVVRGRTSGPPA